MKLRIKGNSIRFRLSRPDIEQLVKKGYLEEKTDFGLHQFSYALNVVSDNNELYDDFSDGLMIMHIPKDFVLGWLDSDKVGFEHQQDIDGISTLYLVLEKDFKCLGKEDELDQKDNFANPKSGC